MKKLRITYAILFGLLLIAEIFIGAFVHDSFIRPFFGDVLVTILLCCLFRIFVPQKVKALPIYVFIFAVLVETAQYLNIVKLLGIDKYPLLSTITGTTFSWGDVVCYGVGCLAFWGLEKVIKSLIKRK